MLFIQEQTPEQYVAVVAGIIALAESRERGLELFATEKELPDRLAEILIGVACGIPAPGVTKLRDHELDDITEFIAIEGFLRLDTRYYRWTARRTVAMIIREEIAAGRIVPVFTRIALLVMGGEVPLHSVVSARQWDIHKSRT